MEKGLGVYSLTIRISVNTRRKDSVDRFTNLASFLKLVRNQIGTYRR